MTDTDQLKARLNSEDGQIRNEAALEIMDAKSEVGFALLIEAVLTPKDERNYGTLVYAMSGFDCGDHTDTIVELMRRDNFEVFNTASDILINQWSGFGERTRQTILSDVDRVISESSSGEEIEFFTSIRKQLTTERV
jgi:hypothetical protein